MKKTKESVSRGIWMLLFMGCMLLGWAVGHPMTALAKEPAHSITGFGAFDYLVKPFTAVRFGQALTSFINRQKTLSGDDTLDQKNIDELIGLMVSKDINMLPKGIQESTLKIVENYLKENAFSKEMTSDEIADGVGISRVTIRRYMNYFIEIGNVTGRMNYETGGRPCMMYIWNKV